MVEGKDTQRAGQQQTQRGMSNTEWWLWVVGILTCIAAVRFYPDIMFALGAYPSSVGSSLRRIVSGIVCLVAVVAVIRSGSDYL
jgi:hypothetical protein